MHLQSPSLTASLTLLTASGPQSPHPLGHLAACQRDMAELPALPLPTALALPLALPLPPPLLHMEHTNATLAPSFGTGRSSHAAWHLRNR